MALESGSLVQILASLLSGHLSKQLILLASVSSSVKWTQIIVSGLP